MKRTLRITAIILSVVATLVTHPFLRINAMEIRQRPIVMERIQNITNNTGLLVLDGSQISYNYNIVSGQSTTLSTIMGDIPAVYSCDLIVNLTNPVDIASITFNFNTAATNNYPLNFIVENGRVLSSNYNTLTVQAIDTDIVYIKLIFTLKQLNDNYSYPTIQTLTPQSCPWVENGYTYFQIMSATMTNATQYQGEYTPKLNSILSSVDGIEALLTQIATSTGMISNIDTNISDIADLIEYQNNILDQYESYMHYFQYRVNDTALTGYPQVIFTENDLNNYYFYGDLNNYTIRRFDIRTKQKIYNGNYVAFTFYFKSNNEFNDTWYNYINWRFRDNTGRLCELDEIYIYYNTKLSYDDQKYYCMLTIYIPIYSFTTYESGTYNLNLSASISGSANYITGVFKVGLIYHGIIDSLPNENPSNTENTVNQKLDKIIELLGSLDITVNDITNVVNQYDTNIDIVYNIENDFSTDLNQQMQQFTPDNTNILQRLNDSSILLKSVLNQINGIEIFTVPIAVTLVGIVLLAIVG